MGRRIKSDGTGLYKRSHRLVQMKTGEAFHHNVEGPFVVELDSENVDGSLPTFYESPALIGRVEFYNDLVSIGIDNIGVHPVEIRDTVNNKTIDGYVLLNIIGKVASADMERSDYKTIGDNMNIINKLVIDPSKANGLDLFLEAKDTDCIVISERVYQYLISKGYDDIYFEELGHRQ